MNSVRFHGEMLAVMAMLVLGSFRAVVQAEDADEDWQVPVTVGKDGWLWYVNSRFGTAFPVPPGMKALRPPDNGDGMAFSSADGKVILTGFGSINVEESGGLETRWKHAIEEPGRTITYQVKKKTWFVVSGVSKNGMGFYEKHVVSGSYAAGWTMTYPQVDVKKYEPWIERIAKGFAPRLGEGTDRVEK